MHLLVWSFWWANVITCIGGIVHLSTKRYMGRVPALFMIGQFWIWQLMLAVVVAVLGASPWHLIWLALVSFALTMIFGRLLYNWHTVKYGEMQEDPTPKTVQWMNSVAVSAALQVLATDEDRSKLLECLNDQPAFAEKFKQVWFQSFRLDHPPSRWELTLLLNQIAVELAQEGDFFAATASLHASPLFLRNNPLHWSAQAEVYCAWQDLLAVEYAKKVIAFRVTKSASAEIQRCFETEEAKKLVKVARGRMKEIIVICGEHPEWRDSYPLKKASGLMDD